MTAPYAEGDNGTGVHVTPTPAERCAACEVIAAEATDRVLAAMRLRAGHVPGTEAATRPSRSLALAAVVLLVLLLAAIVWAVAS